MGDAIGDDGIKMQEDVNNPAASPLNVHNLRPAIATLHPLCGIDAEEECFSMGAEVRITGLSKLPAFNGLTGTIQCFEEDTRRFSVLLFEPVGRHKWVKVKRENLDPVERLPPPMSPLQV